MAIKIHVHGYSTNHKDKVGLRAGWENNLEPMVTLEIHHKYCSLQRGTFDFIITKLIKGVDHMPKKLDGLSDHVLSHWFPMRKSFHACAGKKIGQWRRGRAKAQLNVI